MQKPPLAIVGSGPAGLMAASVLAAAGHAVEVFEKHRSPARKLLIAGRSGLNVSYNAETSPLVSFYDGPKAHFAKLFDNFATKQWLAFLSDLGIATFAGPTRRYFVEGLKAAPLLKAWLKKLKSQNVRFHYQKELTDFVSNGKSVTLTFNGDEKKEFAGVILALGGLSWPAPNQKASWPDLFLKKTIAVTPPRAANAGFLVEWTREFLNEVEGKPLKNITLTSTNGTTAGELTITRYGLEGTPVYNLQNPQTVFLDLKPDLSIENLEKKLTHTTENLSLLRLAKKHLNLGEAGLALIFHHAPRRALTDKKEFCSLIKKFPVTLIQQNDLDNAISMAGGVSFSEVNTDLMLKKFPGIFLAGEMLDWSAPTGGFLIQGCVSEGRWAAEALLQRWL